MIGRKTLSMAGFGYKIASVPFHVCLVLFREKMNANLYCTRIDIPPPQMEDVARREGVKLFELLVVARLERGEPMDLDAREPRPAVKPDAP